MTATVMITAGGTGGHVFPGLAVAAKLVARGARVFWLGTRGGIEATLVPQHGVEFEAVAFRGIRGKGIATFVLGPLALLGACVAALRIIRRRRPDVVLGLGGFASFPGALMGVASGRPLVLHDANAVAGLANRILAFGADRVLTGFPHAMRGRHAKRALWVGNPLRDDIVAVAGPGERFAARRGPLRVLVVGGSLGARALNEAVPAALAAMQKSSRPLVVHQSGARNLAALEAAYRSAGVEAECVAFIDDMAARYAWADLVVCRGGALTVAELAAVGLGAIIVPLPGAIADEQSANAKFLLDAGAAIVIGQDELTAADPPLAGMLAALTRADAQTMAQAAYAVGRRDAADKVASECLDLAGARRRAADGARRGTEKG
ncbi:MAG: undecaprenyldiphospho-muramoylpentapeptide beta-N-acetylglucosaminyltransferase [Proteobacteria bacterium]|jgi:UDP-N-acetylglucosamine--N-acetylmuramyl-(pentapeptide) pyrophosphoryl-undecaprenol N-acetylglucosamine transferase|nr:undecaprenyldiphospho-muramoylpentapeptide beta-N-acetylglucosaminyltransferase [Pseudomonadota bacterium]